MTKRGHPQPNLDNQSQPNLFDELPIPSPPPAEELTFRPPHSVKPLVEAQLDEGDRAWERLDAQGQSTTEKVREDVGHTALTGEDIERQEAKDIKQNAKPSSRPKKDRRHLSWQGKEAADNDAVVKDTYDSY
jgi:hypothetical protein